jgi:hypothetical protein
MAALNHAETIRLHLAETLEDLDALRAKVISRLGQADLAIAEEFPRPVLVAPRQVAVVPVVTTRPAVAVTGQGGAPLPAKPVTPVV